MHLYNLLRLLIKSGAQTGGLTKEQAYDAMNLVEELEKVNGFSHMLAVTMGKHEFKPTQQFTGPYTVRITCGICGKERIHCE